MRKNFNIPSPKSQSPKKELPRHDAPCRAQMLPHLPTEHAHLASQRYSRKTMQDQMHSKMIAAKARRPSHAARSPDLRCLYPIQHTYWHADLPLHNFYKPRSYRYPSRYRRVIAKVEQETHFAAPRKLELWDLLARPPRVGQHPLLREHPAPHSDRRCGAMPDLQKRKKSMQQSQDTGEWMPMT